MRDNQTVLGFSRIKIEYCYICGLKYNKTNLKDINLHFKIHRKPKIPKAIQLCKDFYQKKNIYYYGHSYIEALCEGKEENGILLIKKIEFESTEAKNNLLANLRLIYKVIKI